MLFALSYALLACQQVDAASDTPAPTVPVAPNSGPPVPVPFFAYNSPPLVRTRLDPIIDPSDISGHVHVFAGANRITADMDHASAIASNCTTAPMSLDKSGYWAPQLYYKSRQGKYHAMSHFGIITYWLYRGFAQGEEPPELPADFRMLGGSMKRIAYDAEDPAHRAISFQCFGPGYDFNVPYIPADFECETLRPQVEFPNCWNGKDVYTPDQSHVAYGAGDRQTGPCPSGFRRIPTLLLEIAYNPKLAMGDEYEWYPGCFVFSHGDIHGLTFHADWLNGFPAKLLVDVFKQCKSMEGSIDTCPLLAQHAQDGSSCTLEGHIAVGNGTPLDALPGDNPEFNSSLSAKPKTSGYTEQSRIVQYATANGGGCEANVCADYTSGGTVVQLDSPVDVFGGASSTVAGGETGGGAAVSAPETAAEGSMGPTNLLATSDVEPAPGTTSYEDLSSAQATASGPPGTTEQPTGVTTIEGTAGVAPITPISEGNGPTAINDSDVPTTTIAAVVETGAQLSNTSDTLGPAVAQQTYGVPEGMTGGRSLIWPDDAPSTATGSPGLPRRRMFSAGQIGDREL